MNLWVPTAERAHLLVYLRYLDANGEASVKYASCIQMTKDEQKVKEFASELGHPIDDNYNIALKGGLNQAYLLHKLFDNKFDGAVDFNKVFVLRLMVAGNLLPLHCCSLCGETNATLVRTHAIFVSQSRRNTHGMHSQQTFPLCANAWACPSRLRIS
jgi:hypothetical protein